MKDLVSQASQGFQTRLELVDVDRDPQLVRRFGEDVPVLFINGRKFAKHRVELARLRWKLTRESWRSRFA